MTTFTTPSSLHGFIKPTSQCSTATPFPLIIYNFTSEGLAGVLSLFFSAVEVLVLDMLLFYEFICLSFFIDM